MNQVFDGFSISQVLNGDDLAAVHWPAKSCFAVCLQGISQGKDTNELNLQTVRFCEPSHFLNGQWGIAANDICYIILFDETFLLRRPFLNLVIPSFQAAYGGHGMDVTINTHSTVKNLGEMIVGEWKQSEKHNEELICALLHSLLLSAQPSVNPFNSKTARLDLPASSIFLVSRFRALLTQQTIDVKKNKGFDRSVSSLAKKLHVHPNYLNQIVKKVTGNTVQQEIRRSVLSLAKDLLLSDLSIKEIVSLLSFRAPAHFTNFFKKNVLQTPSKFRQCGRLSFPSSQKSLAKDKTDS